MIQTETKFRSFIKSFTWRFVATITGTLVSMYFTGNFILSLKMSITANLIGFCFYFFHERIWNKIKWQKIDVE